jgi:hypothetical protein
VDIHKEALLSFPRATVIGTSTKKGHAEPPLWRIRLGVPLSAGF